MKNGDIGGIVGLCYICLICASIILCVGTFVSFKKKKYMQIYTAIMAFLGVILLASILGYEKSAKYLCFDDNYYKAQKVENMPQYRIYSTMYLFIGLVALYILYMALKKYIYPKYFKGKDRFLYNSLVKNWLYIVCCLTVVVCAVRDMYTEQEMIFGISDWFSDDDVEVYSALYITMLVVLVVMYVVTICVIIYKNVSMKNKEKLMKYSVRLHRETIEPDDNRKMLCVALLGVGMICVLRMLRQLCSREEMCLITNRRYIFAMGAIIIICLLSVKKTYRAYSIATYSFFALAMFNNLCIEAADGYYYPYEAMSADMLAKEIRHKSMDEKLIGDIIPLGDDQVLIQISEEESEQGENAQDLHESNILAQDISSRGIPALDIPNQCEIEPEILVQ